MNRSFLRPNRRLEDLLVGGRGAESVWAPSFSSPDPTESGGVGRERGAFPLAVVLLGTSSQEDVVSSLALRGGEILALLSFSGFILNLRGWARTLSVSCRNGLVSKGTWDFDVQVFQSKYTLILRRGEVVMRLKRGMVVYVTKFGRML